MDYRTITNLEDLKREKAQTLHAIGFTSKQMKQQMRHTVLPKDTSLIQSPIGMVRYAAYGITAYKSYNAFTQFLKLLIGKHGKSEK